MRQAVVLAGGKGTRLRERLNGRPKPLVDVGGEPLLGLQLALLRRSGFDEAVILVNHAADQIRAFCAAAEPGLTVVIIDDGEPRGTAGAVLAALDGLDERFLVIYGDTLLDVDLDRFWKSHSGSGADATLFLHPNDHPHDSDLVELDETGAVRGFHSYPHDPVRLLPNLVNAALYMIDKRALLPFRDALPPLDFAKDLFPQMVRAGCKLRGYVTFEYIKDIGTPARLDKAVTHLRSGVVERSRLTTPQRAVFLDRDGTLNEHRGYVRSPDQLEVIQGAAKAIKSLNDAEYRVVVVTNQPVIARGEATVPDVQQIHAKLETEIGRSGAFIDRILMCPHHPDAGYPGEVAALKIRCTCRKPEIGLIDQARDALNVDLSRSWFIGDTTVDCLAAKRAGLRSILVRTGEGGRDGKYRVSPDLVFDDVGAAATFIVRDYPRIQDLARDFADTVEAGDLILVGGLSRTGKSTLTQVLAWTLRAASLDVAVLRLDRFLRDLEKRPAQGGVLTRYDLPAVADKLKPWLKGGTDVEIALPWYDRWSRRQHHDVDTLLLGDRSVLIVEGVPALGLDLDTQRRVRRLQLVTDCADRHRRVIADLVERSASAEEANRVARFRGQDETPTIEALGSRADLRLTLDGVFQDAHREEPS